MRSTLIAFVLGILLGAAMGHGLSKPGAPLAYQVRVDTLVKEAARLDTVWRTRKVRYETKMARYDTVRVTDTLMRNDTIFIPREVADSAVSACRAVVLTCELQKANLTARLAIAESTIAHPDLKPAIMAGTIGLILGLILR